MSRYFIGNVYNDWGSSFAERAKDARGGELDAAETLREKANAYWEKSLQSYARVKSFAPIMSKPIQVGLIYTKMGDLETAWGDKKKPNPLGRGP